MCILFLLRSLSLFSFSVFIRPRIMKHEQNLQWLHFISVPFHLCFSRAHVENIWVVNARGNGILLIICLCFSSAKLLLEELHILEEDVYSTTLKACLSSLRHMDDCPDDNSLTNIFSEDEQQSGDLLDKAVSCASVMVLVHNMLKLDYTMQEKIVKALCIKTASSELEGYCQMWDLRPYIDDNVIQLAWQFVS
jgi:hypothetical protein